MSSSAYPPASSCCCWVHCGTLLYPVFLRPFSDWLACHTSFQVKWPHVGLWCAWCYLSGKHAVVYGWDYPKWHKHEHGFPFSLSFPFFVTQTGAKKNVCKNTYKHVEKARKDSEKAGSVQRARFIGVSSSLRSLDLCWASLHNPDGWCAVPLPLSCTQRKAKVSKVSVLLSNAGDYFETIMQAVIGRKSLGTQWLPSQPRAQLISQSCPVYTALE